MIGNVGNLYFLYLDYFSGKAMKSNLAGAKLRCISNTRYKDFGFAYNEYLEDLRAEYAEWLSRTS